MKKTKLLTISLAAALYSSAAVAQYNENISFDNRLVDAVNSNNINIVEAILSTGENPNQAGKFETSPLHRAAVNGNIEIAKLLIENGADVNIQDYGGASPLHVAARVGEIEFAKILIQNNADINGYDAQGFTPLHRAVVNKQVPISIFFIKAGADVNTANNDGNTPIIDAVRNSQPSILRELIIAGADKSARNNNGQDAIDFAIKEGNPEIDFLLSADVKELVASDNSIPSFLKKEAKISPQNNGFKQVFDDTVKVPTENVVAEDIQSLAPIVAPQKIKNTINLDKNISLSELPASMQNRVAKKIEDIKPQNFNPIKLQAVKEKPKSLDNKKVDKPAEASKPEAKNIPEKTKPVLTETKPVEDFFTPKKDKPKLKTKQKVKEKIESNQNKEDKKDKETKIQNDIKPIALPKLQFIDIPMQIEEDISKNNSLSFDSSNEINKEKNEDIIKLPSLKAAEQIKPKLQKKLEEKKIIEAKALENKVEKLEPSILANISPASEIPASMKNRKPTFVKSEPEKQLNNIIPNKVINSQNSEAESTILTFPVNSLQIISLNGDNSLVGKVKKGNSKAITRTNADEVTSKIEQPKTEQKVAIDLEYLKEVDDLLNSANANFSTQLVDVNFEMVEPEVKMPASLQIKEIIENKVSSKKTQILETKIFDKKEDKSEVSELKNQPTIEKTSENLKTLVTNDYDSYRSSLVSNIKEFYNSDNRFRNNYSLTALEQERERTLGIKMQNQESFAPQNDNSFLQSDVVAAPANIVETEDLASISLDDEPQIIISAKKALGFNFSDSGHFAVIGSFENENEASNYIKKAAEDFSDEIKFTIEKDSISNKYLLKIGAVEEKDNAQKLCELFSSTNLTCDIN